MSSNVITGHGKLRHISSIINWRPNYFPTGVTFNKETTAPFSVHPPVLRPQQRPSSTPGRTSSTRSTPTQRSYPSTQLITLKRLPLWHICLLLCHPLPHVRQMNIQSLPLPCPFESYRGPANLLTYNLLTYIMTARYLISMLRLELQAMLSMNSAIIHTTFTNQRDTASLSLTSTLTRSSKALRNHGQHGNKFDFRSPFLLSSSNHLISARFSELSFSLRFLILSAPLILLTCLL